MTENDVIYITLNHFDDYIGYEAVRPGMRLKLIKDHNNPYDDEAVMVRTERGEKCGYVANSVHSVCRGTYSAGHIYESFGEETFCTVKFVCEDLAIGVMEFH